MFDRQMLAMTKPAVDAVAAQLHRLRITANQVSLTGFGLGMLAAVLIAHGNIWLAIVPLLLNRLLDGLDGAVARLGGSTDRGAFLDISLDFLFYAAVPLAFGFLRPAPQRACRRRVCWPPSLAPAHLSLPMPSWPRSAARRAPPTLQRASIIWAASRKGLRPCCASSRCACGLNTSQPLPMSTRPCAASPHSPVS